MSQQLASFVAPVTNPLSTMKNQFGYLSASLTGFNGQLQRQAAHLLSGNGTANFQGMTADAFTKSIEYYLNISTQHSSMLEQAATITQTCITQTSLAVDTAIAKNPNDILVNYVLNRVTLDEVLQQGSSPVEAVLNEMHRTLSNMTSMIQKYASDAANAGKSFGQAFVDLFSGNFGGAGHDFQQSFDSFASSWSDLGQFLLETGEYVWESVFELTAAALIQSAQEIWQAMTRCTQAISDLVAKIAHLISGFAKDEQIIMNDLQKGNFTAALNEYLKDFINPELQTMGLQAVSASQIEEIIKEQAPGLWSWLQHLPWWAWVAAIAVIVAVIIGVFVVRMFLIQADLARQGITATKGQIWSLLWQGYSAQDIEWIVRVANLKDSEGVGFQRTPRRRSFGHTLTHVGLSNSSMEAAVIGGKRAQTSFPDAKTAQSAVNYAIAHSPTLQNWILHGAPNSEVWDRVCRPWPANYGSGYKRNPTPPPPAIKIGPLRCIRIGLFRDASGKIHVFDAYPVE